MYFHTVIKLLFSNTFLSDQWLPYVLINITRLLPKEIFQEPFGLLTSKLGAQATFLGAQDKFDVVNGGEGGRGGWLIGKDRGGGWSELWKYRGGVLGHRFSMRH